MIKISIVIPCYNAASYIERCLDSIINQSFKDYEVIIINDGSKDNLETVCKPYIEKYNEIKLYSFCNQGVSQARNEGLLLANGEYIFFCDPDDYLKNNTLQIAYNKAKENDYDAVHFGYTSIYENLGGVSYDNKGRNHIYSSNSEIISNLLPKFIGFSQSDCNIWKKVNNIWSLKEFTSVWRFIYKRKVLIDNNIFFRKGITLGEDKLFNSLFFLYANKIYSIEDILYNYIIRDNGLMMSSINNIKLVENKISGVIEREYLRSLYLNEKGIDIFSLYIGTYVLSALEILFSNQNLPVKKSYCIIRKYLNIAEVKYAINRFDIKGLPLNYKIPILLLKFNSEIIIILILKIAKSFGIKISK